MPKAATSFTRPEDSNCAWSLIDASGQVLGRLASQIAHRLRGKHREDFTPSTCMGDYVVVVNADLLRVTGRKASQKKYYRHSGYPGSLKERTFEEAMEQSPEKVLRLAVRGMLPKNRLGRVMMRKLHIYSGAEHPHDAQKPARLQ